MRSKYRNRARRRGGLEPLFPLFDNGAPRFGEREEAAERGRTWKEAKWEREHGRCVRCLKPLPCEEGH
jgi:hypothetical protein